MSGERTARWPGGARSAVVFTFDLDAELFWLRLHESAKDRPKTLSLGEYGVSRGLPRVLDLLAEHQVPSSWFVPAWTAKRYPDAVLGIGERGHEIGCRGLADETVGALSRPELVRTITEAADALTGLTGVRPRGYRPPPGRVGDDLAGVLAELGFGWSSTGVGDDLPFLLEDAGRPTSVVEIPSRWEHTDYPYFAYNSGVVSFPPGRSRVASYEAVLEEWKAAFDAYHELGLCLVFRLEPQVIGKPGRFLLLERLLAHVLAAPDVWVTTGGELAEHWRAHQPGNDPAHPEHVRSGWLTD